MEIGSPGSNLIKLVAALIRHGAYEQPADVPSAHLSHPLTAEGEAQAAAHAPVLAFAEAQGLEVASVIDSSNLLRGWQTASLLAAALETDSVEHDLDFLDWPRDPGKVGRKDSYVDLRDGRACRKVRTGMQYLLSDKICLVFGACLKNDNQVINLVVSQFIGWMMNRGWALCHASGVVVDNKGLAIAAFSGGGKSTLALHLVRRGLGFVSNDRLLIGCNSDVPMMAGVPKHRRINPGAVLDNPSLETVIPQARHDALALLPEEEIWDLEEKYDALIDQLFGPDRFQLLTPMSGFLRLNWQRDSSESMKIKQVDLKDRPDMLRAVMKPPGPFYVPTGAAGPSGFVDVDPADYLPLLDRVPVYEATGVVDFDAAVDFCQGVVASA